MSDGGRKAHSVKHRSAADDDDIAAAVELGRVHALQHPLQDVDVVLDRLAARNELNVARQREPIRTRFEQLPDLLL